MSYLIIEQFLKTMTTLVQLLPNLTSVQHSNALMRKYVTSCQTSIQSKSLAILQSNYSTNLSDIPEEPTLKESFVPVKVSTNSVSTKSVTTLTEATSPIRSVSPDLKLPQSRSKPTPRRSVVQPSTRRSIAYARRKSCDSDLPRMLYSTPNLRTSSSTRDHSVAPPHPRSTSSLAAQIRRINALDVSKSVDITAERPKSRARSFTPTTIKVENEVGEDFFKPVSSPRRSTTGSTRRRISDIDPFRSASVDVARSVDWGRLCNTSS